MTKSPFKYFILFLTVLLPAVLLLSACESGSPSGEGHLLQDRILREISYYSRAYGEEESANTLTRTLRFTVLEDGNLQKDALNGEGSLYLREIYSPEGVLLRAVSFDGGETTRTVIYTIENGRCVREEEYEGEPLGESLLFLNLREYDGQGELSYEQLSRMENGELKVQYTHRLENSYDDAGNMIAQDYICEEEAIQNVSYRWVYDGDGRLKKFETTLYDGSTTSKEYDYDKQGSVIEERSYEEDVLSSVSAFRYSYDEQGRVLRREEMNGSVTVSLAEYSYDSRGDCVRTLSYSYGKLSSSVEFSAEYLADSELPSRTVRTQLSYAGKTDAAAAPESGNLYTTVFAYENAPENAALNARLLELAGF